MGLVQRMDDHPMPKKILNEEICSGKGRGRQRKRWIRDVDEDDSIIIIRGWRMKIKDGQDWSRTMRQAEVHTGQQRHANDDDDSPNFVLSIVIQNLSSR